MAGGSFSETQPGFSCSLEERWSLHQKETENLKNVSNDPLLMTQCLKKSQPPTETNKKISSTNSQTLQQALHFTAFVKNDKLVGAGLPFAGAELDSHNNSQRTHLPLPENDFSSCEISYSPLQSDEETYDIDEKLDDSQQELFFSEGSKDGSLEEDDSSTDFKLPGPFLKDLEESCPKVNSFLTQEKCTEELYKCSALNSSQLSFQTESSISYDDAEYTDGQLLLSSPALRGEPAASNCQTTKAKPGEPDSHSSQPNKQKQVIENPTGPLLQSKMFKPFESQGGECLSFPLTQSKVKQPSSENFCTRNDANSAHFHRKALDGMLDGDVTVLNTEKNSSAAAKSPLKILPSGPKCNARHPSTKVMKQMDIGVYFGLPPKRKEEKSLGESAVEGMNLNPITSPNGKRSRQCKRKAEKSLSDLEFDAKDLNESQLSVELPAERSQRQRKRHKMSNSPQEGARGKRSGHLINDTESGTANSSKDNTFKKSAHGRLQRDYRRFSESANAGELRKKTCPFYKKIPGKLEHLCSIYQRPNVF